MKAFVLAFVILGVMSASPRITVESPLPWLQIIPSTDAQFNSRVSAAIGSDVADKIAYALPYSVVVTNAGSTPITGVGILYQVKYAGHDKPVMRSFFYQNFGRPNPVISPGQSRVFTPLKTATALAAGHVLVGRGGQGAPDPSRLEPISVVSEADELHISIDLAVSPDWHTAGADLSKFVASMNAQHAAFKAMRDEVLARLKSGQPNEVLQSWLQSMAGQQIVVRRGQHLTESHFTTMQVSLAGEWLAMLKKGDRAGLENRVTAITPEMAFQGANRFQGGLQ